MTCRSGGRASPAAATVTGWNRKPTLYLSKKALRFMSMSYWLRQRLKRWRMLVLLAIMRPLTRCAEGAYGDFLDNATCIALTAWHARQSPGLPVTHL